MGDTLDFRWGQYTHILVFIDLVPWILVSETPVVPEPWKKIIILMEFSKH